MTQAHQASPESPRPSVRDMQRRLATELSVRTRVVYTLLLTFDLAVACVVGSLWITEPSLPTRTSVAFAVIVLAALVWAVLLAWTLIRRKILLTKHRVITSRVAVFSSAVFTACALALAASTPALREVGLAAGGLGGVLLALALFLWRRAVRRYKQLVDRTRELERDLASTSPGSLLFLLFFMGSGLVFTPAETVAQLLTPAPIEMRVSNIPIPVPALGRRHLVYELHLTNFGPEPRQLAELAVLDTSSGRVLDSWVGDELARRLAPVGVRGRAAMDPLVISPGSRTVGYLWVVLNGASDPPHSISHRLRTVDVDGGAEDTLLGASVLLGPSDLPLTRPPIGPRLWVALRGPSNMSGHRRSLVALDGGVRVPQRFAVDWARLGDDGRLYRGDGSQNEDWYGYGQPVRAARGGRPADRRRGRS